MYMLLERTRAPTTVAAELRRRYAGRAGRLTGGRRTREVETQPRGAGRDSCLVG